MSDVPKEDDISYSGSGRTWAYSVKATWSKNGYRIEAHTYSDDMEEATSMLINVIESAERKLIAKGKIIATMQSDDGKIGAIAGPISKEGLTSDEVDSQEIK